MFLRYVSVMCLQKQFSSYNKSAQSETSSRYMAKREKIHYFALQHYTTHPTQTAEAPNNYTVGKSHANKKRKKEDVVFGAAVSLTAKKGNEKQSACEENILNEKAVAHKETNYSTPR